MKQKRKKSDNRRVIVTKRYRQRITWICNERTGYEVWCNNPKDTYECIMEWQKVFNEILVERGVLLLSEVYVILGLEPTRESAIMGWILDESKYMNMPRNRFPIELEVVPLDRDGDVYVYFTVDGIVYRHLPGEWE